MGHFLDSASQLFALVPGRAVPPIIFLATALVQGCATDGVQMADDPRGPLKPVAFYQKYIDRTNELSRESLKKGNTPFGALLIDKNGKILMEQGNVQITQKDATGHAETELIRRASRLYSPGFLWKCTLVTNVESCAMCVGAEYWGNVGTIVYGLSRAELMKLLGNYGMNPTLTIDTRDILKTGTKDIRVIGPIYADEVRDALRPLWKTFKMEKN